MFMFCSATSIIHPMQTLPGAADGLVLFVGVTPRGWVSGSAGMLRRPFMAQALQGLKGRTPHASDCGTPPFVSVAQWQTWLSRFFSLNINIVFGKKKLPSIHAPGGEVRVGT